MDIQPIRNSSDHENALKRIEALMLAKQDSADGDELDVLATLVDAYERQHFPIDSPEPVEAIKFRMPIPAFDVLRNLPSRLRRFPIPGFQRLLGRSMFVPEHLERSPRNNPHKRTLTWSHFGINDRISGFSLISACCVSDYYRKFGVETLIGEHHAFGN